MLVFLTPIFIEETASTFGRSGPEGDWREHLTFALDICNGGIFQEKVDIWHSELVEGKGLHASYLLPERESQRGTGSRPRLVEVLRTVAATGDIRREWLEIRDAREESLHKKMRQKATASRIRQDVSQALKTLPSGKPVKASFQQFRATELERVGRHLMSIVDRRRQQELGDEWARNPDRYPYYTAFAEGLLYANYYAAVEHNKPIDDNAQADYEQLAYLARADLIVTNDTKFQRHAFSEIWAPRGKRLETAETFAAFCERIA